MDIQEILKSDSVHIIDVREKYEYESNHVPASVNMPLSSFGLHIDMIKDLQGKKVLYCRSGNRSGQAVEYLKGMGIKEVYNGGSITLMNSFLID